MRILDFIAKELLQLRRDKRLMFFLFAMPVLQLTLFGYAVSTDIKHMGVTICDLDRTAESRDLVREITASEYFDYLGAAPDLQTAQALLTAGRTDVVVVIHREFEKRVKAGDTAEVQALVDGSNPNTGTIAAGYLGAIFQTRSVRMLTERVSRAGSSPLANAGVDARMRVWYNPALESKFTMVPGVVCVVVGMMTMMLSSTAIVKEREDGTIEQLMVTPTRTWELMIGKMLPILIVGYIDIISILVAGVLLFHVPIRGSVPLLLLFAGPFLTASLAIGLIISTASKTQQQASMTMSFFAMPNILLSGFIFPINNMPHVLQAVTYFIPMRYFLVTVRDILLKGSGASLLWDQILPLTLLAIGYMCIATWRFQKRLD